MRRVAPRLIATLALALLLAACPGPSSDTVQTSIAFFDASATSVERGDPVTLSWRVDNPGTAPGAASCSISRRAENDDPEDPFEVACSSTLTEIPPVPATSSFIRYQLNALKRPFEAANPYVTEIITINLATQQTTYGASAGGTSFDRGYAVSAFDDGSAVVTGFFNGTASFGGTTLTSSGSDDVFVARIDPNGSWVWATRAGGTSADQGFGVSALGDGSAIVTGYFAGTATFGATTLTSTGSNDVFVARIEPNGTWAWAARAGGADSTVAFDVRALDDGDAIVTGYFAGTATFGATTLTSTGSNDVFVARIEPNGTWAWAARAGGTGSDIARRVATLADGSAIVTGRFVGTATFGSTTLTSLDAEDVFVARIEPNGTWAWATRAGGTSFDIASGVSALSDGGAIVTGDFDGTAAFGAATLTSAGNGDVFVARIEPNGTWAWATRAGGASSAAGYSVSTLLDGSAIITGRFAGTAAFGATNLTSVGSPEAFVARINANGTWAWATRAATADSSEGFGVSTLNDGSAIVTGNFAGTAAFGGTALTSRGSVDVFVAKIDALGAW